MADPTVDGERLIVPINVDALAVNEAVRGNSFRRWQPDFQRLEDQRNPEPDPFEPADTAFAGRAASDGVYLHWHLPEALCRGRVDPDTGNVRYPPVPNRWLVVRYAGRDDSRQAQAWVIESDYLDEKNGTSPYLHPATGAPTRIGRRHNLAEGPWRETSAPKPFLTAVGPGLPAFATFQPYNEDVFSMHDDLTGVADQDTISYLVVGWHSDPEADPLAGERPIDSILAGLGWQITRAGKHPVAGSVYCGRVLGLVWDRTGSAPESARPAPGDIRLTIGQGAADALTDAAESPGDEVRPDTSFTASPGGYTWRLAGPRRGQRELQVLAGLNQAQRAHDLAALRLAAMERQQHSEWWLANSAEVASLRKTVNKLRSKIPWGNTRQELVTSGEIWATHHDLAPDCRLDRVESPPFYEPADPVLAITGISGKPPAKAAKLPCRFTDQLVTAIRFKDTELKARPILPPPLTTGLPHPVTGLLDEFSVVAAAAESTGGTAALAARISEGLALWRQPWEPIWMQWQGEKYPIDRTQWTLEGGRLRWGSGDPGTSYSVRGRSTLQAPAGWDTVFATCFADYNAVLERRPPGTSPSLSVRGGQFRMTQLNVVDRFGRTVDINVTDTPPRVAGSLTPGQQTVPDHPRDQLIELPPRLTQPARLVFDSADPVCGWIMPKSHGKRLQCYAPDGSPLGILTADHQQVVWAPLAESPDAEASHAHLRQFRESLIAQGPAAFTDLMSVIDRPKPGQQLDHRPVALIRARLRLELNSTIAVPDQRSKDPADDRWQVRLGGDGLVGFYSTGDFHTLNTDMASSSAKSNYLRRSGAEFLTPGADTTLTVLIDPFAQVVATTDILPQETLRLPDTALSSALARISSNEPVLTPTKPA